MALELHISTPEDIRFSLNQGSLLLQIQQTPYIFVIGLQTILPELIDPDVNRDAYNLQQGKIIKTYLDTSKELKSFLKRDYKRARQNITKNNEGLVKDIADKYKNSGILLDDLIQEGMLGLFEATKDWDYKKGKLSTHADDFIKGNIRRAFFEFNTRTIHVPRYLYDKREQIKKRERELTQNLGRRPTKSEIAKGLTYSSAGNKRPLKPSHIRGVKDLDKEVQCLEVYSPSQNTPEIKDDPHESLEQDEEKRRLRDLMKGKKLNDTETQVTILKYGLEGNEALNNREIGDQLGYSRARIQQIAKEAVRKLRFQMQITE